MAGKIGHSRRGNLYQEICKFENIMKAFDTVCKNTKNKRKVSNFKTYKCIYVNQIYRILNNKEYKVGKYNVFKIYEPKERIIVSLNMFDKVVNNLITKKNSHYLDIYLLYKYILL